MSRLRAVGVLVAIAVGVLATAAPAVVCDMPSGCPMGQSSVIRDCCAPSASLDGWNSAPSCSSQQNHPVYLRSEKVPLPAIESANAARVVVPRLESTARPAPVSLASPLAGVPRFLLSCSFRI